jgi:transporter family-2 protein
MSAQLLLYYLLAVMVGILGGIHVPINGALASRISSTLVATFTFYGIAFVIISLICLATWEREAFVALRYAPRWYFLAGVISVVVVGSSTFLIPRIGAINLFVVVLSLQLVARAVISHFGWLESPINPLTWVKVFGAVMLIAGAVLVVRN